MGQALYRKYRTTTLAETAGQEHITKTLDHALKNGNISHAYLFTGPRGVGKTSLARILAHEVNGLPYAADSTHLDIIEIDAASNRRIDEIRELRDRIHIAPTSARYKVYIIDEVHMLTKEAFNALLKTLEEPPEHAIFILATTEAHKVPDTIISRTQRFTFKPYDEEVVAKRLRYIAEKERIVIDDAAIALIAQTGGGSFRDSISLLDQIRHSNEAIGVDHVRHALGIAPTEILDRMLQALHGSPSDVDAILADARSNGYQSGQIAKQLLVYIRKQLVANSEADHSLVDLMSGLINVPTSRDVDTALEIALFGYVLRHASTHTSSANTEEPKTIIESRSSNIAPKKLATQSSTLPEISQPKISDVDTHSKTPPPDEIQNNEINSEPTEQAQDTHPQNEPKSVPISRNANSDSMDTLESHWPAILEAVKSKYNTLYGVLRMARAEFTNTSLILHFQFAFHQKRINEPRNKQIINDIIKDITKQDISIECMVNKTPEHADDSPVTTSSKSQPQNSNISAVESIFGGAEIVSAD